jgi:hypothetical protein
MVRIPQVIVDQRRRNAVILSNHQTFHDVEAGKGLSRTTGLSNSADDYPVFSRNQRLDDSPLRASAFR